MQTPIHFQICILLILMAANSVLAQSETTVFDGPSVIPEWHPAKGVFISFPFRLPDDLIKDFAGDTKLHLLIRESDQVKANAKFKELGIDSRKIEFINCSVDSEWPRDWGPHQIFDRRGTFGIVDPDFQGYPAYPQAGGKAVHTYRTGKGDDKVNVEIGKRLNVAVDACPAFVTGGNFLVDGMGTAFCTQAMLEENKTKYDEQTLGKLLKGEFGITRLVILENTESVGIQHIDCWMKVLDPNTLLIKRAPQGHPDELFLERNVEKLSKLKNADGHPYRIVRIDCPRVKVSRVYPDADPIAAYTNSLILNDKVYVPLFNCDGDATALETWRKAMPGYSVQGYPYDKWMDFDALHCRSRALFDRDSIWMTHTSPGAKVSFAEDGYKLTVSIRNTAVTDADKIEGAIFYRVQGTQAWSKAPLETRQIASEWSGSIPKLKKGNIVEYYFKLSGEAGRTAKHPVIAPKNFHRFEIAEN